MQRVEVCYAREAAATGSGTRDGVAILLSILAIIGALTVASLLFWNAKLYREIGIPVAVISAALIAVSSVLPDGGRARANSARAKVEQEKWRWTIRMARSNQMADDGKAIDEALAATDDLINRLSSGGAE